MKPTLQREQRLQMYANTHPFVGIRTSELADHKRQTVSLMASLNFYQAPGPEKLPRGLLRSSRGTASFTRRARPATSLPFRLAMASAAS